MKPRPPKEKRAPRPARSAREPRKPEPLARATRDPLFEALRMELGL